MGFRRSVMVLACALLTACGGSDETADPGAGAPTPSKHAGDHTGGASGDCEDLSGSGPATIVLKDNVFEPACFTVSGDQGLELRNDGSALHSFTLMNIDLDLDVQAGEFTTTEPIGQVLEAGTYDYHCTYHPEMTGQITVA